MTVMEHTRRMAMLRAAQPYTSGQQRYALDLLLQADALVNTARSTAPALEACDTMAQPEEMLAQLQQYCTPRESDLIQMLLNFIQASHLFRNYREFVAAQPNGELQAAGLGAPSSHPLRMLLQLLGGMGGTCTPGAANTWMDFLITQLPPEQKQLFEQLRASFEENDRKEDAP